MDNQDLCCHARSTAIRIQSIYMTTNSHPSWQHEYADLARASTIVAKADPQTTLKLIRSQEQAKQYALAAATQLLFATQFRDLQSIRTIRQTKAQSLLRSDAALHYVLVWCLYCSQGVQASSDEVSCYLAANHQPLYRPWLQNLNVLAELVRQMDGAATEIHCPLPGTIPLLNNQQLAIVQATVNSSAPAHFIIDTGAPCSLLSTAFAQHIGLHFKSEIYRTGRDGAGNILRLFPGVLDHMVIGTVHCRHYPVLVTDLSSDLNIAGILSPLDLFRKCFVEMDFQQNRLRLFPGTHGSRPFKTGKKMLRLPVHWNGNCPMVRVQVNEAEGIFLLDTGAGANLLCQTFADGLQSMNPDGRPLLETPTAAGKTLIRRGGRGWLSVGHESPVEMDFLMKSCVTDPDDLFTGRLDGFVGMPWFRQRRIGFYPYGKGVVVGET